MEKVLFILLPFCKLLPKEVKNEFHENVNRTNVKTKVQELLSKRNQFIETAKYELKLQKRFEQSIVINIFAKHIKIWKTLCFYCTLLLNFIILVSFSGVSEDERLYKPRLFDLSSESKFGNLVF